MYCSCQSETWNIFTCEISKTTEPIELKFSGVIEGVHKLAVLKFQNNPIRLNIKAKIRKFWVHIRLVLCYGLVRTRISHWIPENLYI